MSNKIERLFTSEVKTSKVLSHMFLLLSASTILPTASSSDVTIAATEDKEYALMLLNYPSC